jgi:hypothetical protein
MRILLSCLTILAALVYDALFSVALDQVLVDAAPRLTGMQRGLSAGTAGLISQVGLLLLPFYVRRTGRTRWILSGLLVPGATLFIALFVGGFEEPSHYPGILWASAVGLCIYLAAYGSIWLRHLAAAHAVGAA